MTGGPSPWCGPGLYLSPSLQLQQQCHHHYQQCVALLLHRPEAGSALSQSHTFKHTLTHTQPAGPAASWVPSTAELPCIPMQSPTWAHGTVEGGSGYYGNTMACCSLPLSCSTAGKDHHYKYCSNLFKRDTLERLGDRERMSAAYIDHIKYDLNVCEGTRNKMQNLLWTPYIKSTVRMASCKSLFSPFLLFYFIKGFSCWAGHISR